MSLFERIAYKVNNGMRLSDQDALDLFAANDVNAIGQLADLANQRINGDVVFYNVNRHINPTNICAMSCKFCAYSRKPGEEGAYAYEIPEIIAKAAEVVKEGATEVHMVGGLHPRWGFSKYTDIVRALKEAFPQLHIKAFTAVELDWMARRDRRPVIEILRDLMDAGLGSLPGGGAEIFHPEIRDQICDTKTTAERWLEIHRTAHELGMKSNCTMLYGHIERHEHRVDHMRRLRELQDITGGFNAFIPLSFQPHDNQMGINRYTIGADDLKTAAIARLYLDNIRNIKSYWIMYGQDIAQLALAFGANDLDGTVTEEKISRMAGGRAGIIMTRAEIETLIRKAQRTPIERDTLYRPVRKSDVPTPATPSLEIERDIDLLLYKVEKHEALTEEQLMKLAQYANLHSLAHCARLANTRLGNHGRGSFGICHRLQDPSQWLQPEQMAKKLATEHSPGALMVIDLESVVSLMIEDDWPRLLDFLNALQRHDKNIEIMTSGTSALWRLARMLNQDVSVLIRCLRNVGVTVFKDAISESTASLTPTELLQTHRECHANELATIAKVELASAFDGSSEPFWQPFLRRLLDLQALQTETHGLLGISIELSRGSMVTTQEYMRAISLARLICTEVPHIITPITAIPTMRPALKAGAPTTDQPVLKIAPMCLHFGASDLGVFALTDYDRDTIFGEIEVSGIKAWQRGARFFAVEATTSAADVAINAEGALLPPVATADGLRTLSQ